MATEYIVIRKTPQSEGAETYSAAGEVEASSAAAAIRAVVTADGNGGEFCAVPARSWRFSPVKVETTRRVRIG